MNMKWYSSLGKSNKESYYFICIMMSHIRIYSLFKYSKIYITILVPVEMDRFREDAVGSDLGI